MARPLLPPSGIFVPTHLIFNNSLPPMLLQTWIQLRCLAWGTTITPCLPFMEVAAIIGKSPATLYRHMAQLRHLAALSWRTTGSGSIIVSFSDQVLNSALHDSQATILSSQNRELPEPPEDPLATTLSSQSRESAVPPGDSLPTILNSKNLGSPTPVGEAQPISINSQNRELPYPPSLNPPFNPDVLVIPEMKPEIQESDQIIRDEVEGGGEREVPAVSSRFHYEGERGLLYSHSRKLANLQTGKRLEVQTSKPSNVAPTIPDPISVYRSLAHLTPNASQRRILVSTVTNLPLWQSTLEHWLTHGWNPRNLTGMLDLYTRGGPSACRYCHEQKPPRREAKTAQEQTHEALEDLRRELSIPSLPSEP